MFNDVFPSLNLGREFGVLQLRDCSKHKICELIYVATNKTAPFEKFIKKHKSCADFDKL